MSTGCQSVSQTGRKIYRVPGRQRDRMTVWQIAGQLKSPLLFKNVSGFAESDNVIDPDENLNQYFFS